MIDAWDIYYDIDAVLDLPSQAHVRAGSQMPRCHTPSVASLAAATPLLRGRPRSNSAETIRPPRRHVPPSPPRPPFVETMSRELEDPPIMSMPPSPPPPAPDSSRLKFSQYIHDSEDDLNTAYDYKSISLPKLVEHTVFREIQMELWSSARIMAHMDLGRRDTRATPLLPRHVHALPNLPNVYGNLRESYVALLALIALKTGIHIISVDKLRQWPGQTEMYKQVANELEDEMSDAYNESNRCAVGWSSQSFRYK
ncbi:hypothetical protein DXG01_002024 [Tephrocybe rancida]|nr:hypothetical protein DXG01_002024 [Tephrocybe rancida]